MILNICCDILIIIYIYKVFKFKIFFLFNFLFFMEFSFFLNFFDIFQIFAQENGVPMDFKDMALIVLQTRMGHRVRT